MTPPTCQGQGVKPKCAYGLIPLWQSAISIPNFNMDLQTMNINLDGKPHYILNVSCDSRIGTAARVTNFLASRECFIAEMRQFDDTMTGRFLHVSASTARLTQDPPWGLCATSFNRLRSADLSRALAKNLSVRFSPASAMAARLSFSATKTGVLLCPECRTAKASKQRALSVGRGETTGGLPLAKNCLQAAKSSAALADGERPNSPRTRKSGAREVRKINGMEAVYDFICWCCQFATPQTRMNTRPVFRTLIARNTYYSPQLKS